MMERKIKVVAVSPDGISVAFNIVYPDMHGVVRGAPVLTNSGLEFFARNMVGHRLKDVGIGCDGVDVSDEWVVKETSVVLGE
jgi:hypothetical protein